MVKLLVIFCCPGSHLKKWRSEVKNAESPLLAINIQNSTQLSQYFTLLDETRDL
jgi:hypothetical protein